jgi:hypothetical protein
MIWSIKSSASATTKGTTAMSVRLSSTTSFRRLVTVALASAGFAGIATVFAAPAANASTHACSYYETRYADADISTLSVFQREHTGWCAVNDARAQNGVRKLANNRYLRSSSLAHAQRAVTLRWWDLSSSHVDPSQAGTDPSTAIAQRIANAGYCSNGTAVTNENTFSAWGNGALAPTINGAVAWWLSDPPHRATLLSTQYRSIGFSALPASAFSQDTGGSQAITVVADFGACN